MRRQLLLLLVTALLVIGLAAPATADDRFFARGSFTTELDVATFTTTPVGATACRVTVEGTLTFTGTLDGTADGATTALIFAPCDDVQTTPPGTFRDVFRSQLAFDGTVAGWDVTADIRWLGATRAGGDIDSVMVLDDGVDGWLRVDAVVGVGGTYRGTLRTD